MLLNIIYADETQLYIGVHLPDAGITKIKLEACVGEVRKGMAANMLKLNYGKTEYIVIGSNYMIQQIPLCLNSINIGHSTISKATSARDIGVIMDEELSMEQQVNNDNKSVDFFVPVYAMHPQVVNNCSKIMQCTAVHSLKCKIFFTYQIEAHFDQYSRRNPIFLSLKCLCSNNLIIQELIILC